MITAKKWSLSIIFVVVVFFLLWGMPSICAAIYVHCVMRNLRSLPHREYVYQLLKFQLLRIADLGPKNGLRNDAPCGSTYLYSGVGTEGGSGGRQGDTGRPNNSTGRPASPPIIRLHVICMYCVFVDFITDYCIMLFWSSPPNTPWPPKFIIDSYSTVVTCTLRNLLFCSCWRLFLQVIYKHRKNPAPENPSSV